MLTNVLPVLLLFGSSLASPLPPRVALPPGMVTAKAKLAVSRSTGQVVTRRFGRHGRSFMTSSRVLRTT